LLTATQLEDQEESEDEEPEETPSARLARQQAEDEAYSLLSPEEQADWPPPPEVRLSLSRMWR
jgi:hypothetical protein